MIIEGHSFLIGADPELFVKSIVTGEFVSAHGLIPGTKENPYKVKGGAVQVDGMAAEFNINPAKCKKQFIRNVCTVMDGLGKIIGDEYQLVATPTCHFGKKFISAQPLEARILGCDPDFNAYTGEPNPVPDVDKPFRTGAGHIHIGWTSGQDVSDVDHLAICRHLVRALDIYMIPMLKYDTDITRRLLYGNAGAFRPKPYGVEYRTPSNFWVGDVDLMGKVYDIIKFTLKQVVKSPHPPMVPNFAASIPGRIERAVKGAYLNNAASPYHCGYIGHEIEKLIWG